MNKFDVCVIGAGASGSLLAILLAKGGKKVCIVDRFDVPAKKILVTGNGRCNITNTNMSSEFYNQNIDAYLSQFGYEDAKNQFAEFGLDIYADEMGRCYPISNSAKTVQFILNHHIQQNNVHFVNAEVLDVEKLQKMNADFEYSVICNQQNIVADKIVFACGINNFSIAMLNKFGIKYKNVLPSLVALKTKQITKRLEGERISDVQVTAEIGDKKAAQVGEVLFKDKGLSGISIFNISAFFAKNGAYNGKIFINLLPKWQKNEISQKINANMSIFKNVHNSLRCMFSKELSSEILRRADISKDNVFLTAKEVETIAQIVSNFEFDVIGAYLNNQVQSGGVCLEGLTSHLQSKSNVNMYFCGEICDVDGICGGYNLQWAWTSANLVAKDIL